MLPRQNTCTLVDCPHYVSALHKLTAVFTYILKELLVQCLQVDILFFAQVFMDFQRLIRVCRITIRFRRFIAWITKSQKWCANAYSYMASKCE